MTMNIKNELEKSIPASIKLSENEKATIRNRVKQSHSPKIHLKPVITFILIVTIIGILSISPIQSEKSSKDTDTDTDTTMNEMEIQNDSILVLTEEQKKQYHQQYVEIVEKAMEKKSGLSIEVAPISTFKPHYWTEPKEFEAMIQSWVDGHLATEREKIKARSSSTPPVVTNLNGETTKSTYIYVPDLLLRIEVTGSFKTQYSASHDRHLFTAADNISTQLASRGNWELTYYEASLIDGGRTYSIRIEGIFRYNGATHEKAFTIEFSCNQMGQIY